MPPKNWQQVKDTFHDALRLDSGERDRFLDKACGDDIEFRIEVESLLISLAEAKSFLEQPVIGEVSQPKSAWQLKNGQAISHYRIVSPIASGGMGEVYLAEDEQLRRNVALKILPASLLENKDRLHRFQREARVVSALNHPNIMTIFEFGTVDEMQFLASEFVNGETLRARLENGRLTLHDTLEIATQMVSALRAAHEAGVIHRDIKPENVMIRDDGYVKILDFGLAKLAAQPIADFESDTKRILSRPGVIMGTVTYMSPEQARARTIDARSDLFSFGVVLFEMLTGRVPFAGETTTDVIAEIIQGTPRPVSSYNSSVPDDMDRIIAKCLEKDRDERYQTAADLLADLKRISKRSEPTSEPVVKEPTPMPLAGKPTEMLTERTTERSVGVSQPRRKSVFVRGGAAVAIVIAVFAIGYWYYNGQNAKQIDSIAVMPFANESGNADVEYLSDGMTETLISSLSQIPNLKVMSRNSVFHYKGKDMDVQAVAKELKVQAVLTGTVTQRGDGLSISVEIINALDNSQIWGRQYNRKLADVFAVQEEMAKQISEKLRLNLTGAERQQLAKRPTENLKAFQYYMQGRADAQRRTREDLLTAIRYYEKALEEDRNYALAYAGLADAYTNLGSRGYILPIEGKGFQILRPR